MIIITTTCSNKLNSVLQAKNFKYNRSSYIHKNSKANICHSNQNVVAIIILLYFKLVQQHTCTQHYTTVESLRQ